jgi:hypothetical protein
MYVMATTKFDPMTFFLGTRHRDTERMRGRKCARVLEKVRESKKRKLGGGGGEVV